MATPYSKACLKNETTQDTPAGPKGGQIRENIMQIIDNGQIRGGGGGGGGGSRKSVPPFTATNNHTGVHWLLAGLKWLLFH